MSKRCEGRVLKFPGSGEQSTDHSYKQLMVTCYCPSGNSINLSSGRDVEGQQRGELKVFLPKIWFIFNYSEVCYPKKLRSKLLRNLKSVSLDSIYSECWVSHQHFRSIFQEMANPKLPFKNTCIKLLNVGPATCVEMMVWLMKNFYFDFTGN